MKKILNNNNIKEITGTPYKMGAKVTLLGNVIIGKKLYERGDVLSIAEIRYLNYENYYERCYTSDEFSEVSWKFKFILSDGENKSEEVKLDRFLVGEYENLELDCYDSLVFDDKKASERAETKDTVYQIIAFIAPILTWLISFLESVINCESDLALELMALGAITLFIAIAIGYLLFYIYNDCFSQSDKYPKNTEAKRAIEMSFAKAID